MTVRDHLLAIWSAALTAVDPRAAVLGQCRLEGTLLTLAGTRIDLAAIGRVVVVGAGKAAATMGQGIEAVFAGLDERLVGGVVVTKHGHALPLRCLRLIEAG
ncbi:MAG: DUF4147 domain-containing protein, partial [Planctomycetes bacterium]|nr:DUF4147 domain-containing protein [Planctomycetota bacterium]